LFLPFIFWLRRASTSSLPAKTTCSSSGGGRGSAAAAVRLPPGSGGGALALAGLRVRQVVLLVAQHPWAHPSRLARTWQTDRWVGGWMDGCIELEGTAPEKREPQKRERGGLASEKMEIWKVGKE
jgi:hypothetical protein